MNTRTYVFHVNKTVEVLDDYPWIVHYPKGTVLYEPEDAAWPWVIASGNGGIDQLDITKIPAWCKAYALLLE